MTKLKCDTAPPTAEPSMTSPPRALAQASRETDSSASRQYESFSCVRNMLGALSNRRKYKKDECNACRTYFTLSTTILTQNDSGDWVFGPPADLRVLEPGNQACCYGCCVAGFCLSFFAHVMGKRKIKFGPELHHVTIRRTLEGTLLVLYNRSRSPVELDILKTSISKAHTSWIPRFRSLFEPKPRISAPLYVMNTSEGIPISGDTGSRAALAKICDWFKTCVTSHGGCGTFRELPLLPTRIIRVSRKGKLKLIEPKGRRGHYVCLSHRWLEKAKMPRCTQGNISSLKKQIPWKWLTPTFRDAIVFTRRFSRWFLRCYPGFGPIQYVWIDSLCIIQDSHEDWEQESSRMCAVYEGAIITVAAAAGPERLFSTAELAHRGVELTTSQWRDCKVYLREPLPDHDSHIETIYNGTAGYTARSRLDLLTRGWVLQERFLSRRWVLFTPHEIMWECFEASDCECGKLGQRMLRKVLPHANGIVPAGLEVETEMRKYEISKQSGDPNYKAFPLPMKIAIHKSLTDSGECRERHLRNWWRRLVERYSALNLTKESDRLPAIGGLANWFHRTIGVSDYVAGHFIQSLPLDLGWYANSPAETSRQATGCNASWAWTACAAEITMPHELDIGTFKVLPKLISVGNPNQTHGGPANVGACIKIRCSLLGALNMGSGGDASRLEIKYFPDRAGDTKLSVDETRYVPLLSLHDDEEKSWMLLHVRPLDAGDLRFRRFGNLQIFGSAGDCSDDMMRVCFDAGEEDVEIELV
ncbi:hypothetical protein QQS21_011245 [Conoideocrella luteorostrata]|uniref:Heterokaryon incompatibility domain-containing protein n=1 Tax=Conoideocrella luteorostrata TaxID=1105319 RepID=A0AAJ0CDM0_9HYPO|nr:hypothetical protein QQS21_011245 [Conoideocrella luteorostrata]